MTEQDITKAIGENLRDMILDLGKVQGGAYCDKSDLKWAYTGRRVLNRVLDARLQAGNVADRVEQVTEMFRAWDVPASWLIDDASSPSDLRAHLEAAGWINSNGPSQPIRSWVGMAAQLDARVEAAILPDGLAISRVTDSESLRTWGAIPMSVNPPQHVQDAMRDVFCELGCGDHLPWMHYTAFLHGKPVARSMIYISNGVAGLYWIATVAEVRRQGIGTALTQYTLREAQRMGHDLVILQATEMGEPIYRRLGFREYSRIGMLTLHL